MVFCFILCAFGVVVIHLSLSLFRRGCGDFCVLNIERNSRTLTSYIPATTATALWNAAWTGPHRADGISHEIFIQRAIQDHMTGPQGKLQKEHPHWFVLWLILCFFFLLVPVAVSFCWSVFICCRLSLCCRRLRVHYTKVVGASVDNDGDQRDESVSAPDRGFQSIEK